MTGLNACIMFDPLPADEVIPQPEPAAAPDNDWQPITPIPADAPLPPALCSGQAGTDYEYRNAEGGLSMIVRRFDLPDGSKDIRPLTFCRHPDGRREWRWKGLPAPRPLYGLDQLAARPDAPVLVVEGEKAADAAAKQFPDYVVVTSQNGAKAADKADWLPLAGRQVTIWPDHDAEGATYAADVACLMQVTGAALVKTVSIPDSFPAKWDLADASPQNVTSQDLHRLLEQGSPQLNMLPQQIANAAQQPEKKKRLPPEQDHLDLARAVVAHIGNENILASDTHVWRWNDAGVWRIISDRELKQFVQQRIEKEAKRISRSLVDGVADVLKSEIFKPEPAWNSKPDFINVLNGELEWNGSDWDLRPHSRENYLTTQVPHVYDTSATCPRFAQFLDEIFAGDADAKDKIAVLLEMIGYTLTCQTRYERFAILIGSGANGKSVVLEVIGLLVGTKNVAAIQPGQLGDRFQRGHLHLKLANLVTEIAEGGQIADAELKAFVSGEHTTAEHKHKSPFDFRPYATFWFGTNHMPRTRDFSDALFRRALVIPFNMTFKAGANADPLLIDKLAAELPGILNLALAAFGKVLKTGKFTEPESCLRAREEWRIEADQVAQFLGDLCELMPGKQVPSAELYRAYTQWAEEAGVTHKLARKNFTNRLQQRGCQLCRGSGGVRLIGGVRIKSMV